MKRNIVNIIHFIRWIDSRHPERDLFTPVAEQIKLAKKFGFKATFLLQYDVLVDEKYTGHIIKEQDGSLEIGGWFEIVQQHTEAAGIEWRGREGFSWDWYANVGFLTGYTQEQREKLIDVYMDRFRDIFGYFPSVIGAWFLDSYSVQCLYEKYSVKAVCICRDQWGTDGYNLWGGYYNGGYYPSKSNMLCPAQTQQEQIKVPLFRMLGSDPVYQYDLGLSASDGYSPPAHQGVCTMEPIYDDCGGNREWVNWFLDETFNDYAQPYGYLQAGQENAFGWPKMEKALNMQWPILKERLEKGEIEILHLGETGEWFQRCYDLTPAVTTCAVHDWNQDARGRQSVWFNSRFYRTNLYREDDRFWIRDIHLFDQAYGERYLNDVCSTADCVYDNLPVADGYRWCGNNIRSGLYVMNERDGDWVEACGTGIQYTSGQNSMTADWTLDNGQIVVFDCRENSLTISYDQNASDSAHNSWALVLKWGIDNVPIVDVQENQMQYEYNHYVYRVYLSKGRFSYEPNRKRIIIHPDGDLITFHF